uniref:Uncharacterized protein n=1 Tax=Romanomermis culicivorax TaxID=13658 RepID=A0A915IRM5_ROMCU
MRQQKETMDQSKASENHSPALEVTYVERAGRERIQKRVVFVVGQRRWRFKRAIPGQNRNQCQNTDNEKQRVEE